MRSRNWFCGFAAIIVLGSVSPALAGDEDERKPTGGYSVAWPAFEGQLQGGPIFHQLKSTFETASQVDGPGFDGLVTPDSILRLIDLGGQPRTSPLTADVLRAIKSSCLGPYSFDEGANWAQLSWVCRVDDQSALAQYVHFKYSPELTFTVWLEDGLIKQINAVEPLDVPGSRRLRMDTYEFAKGEAEG